MKRTLSFLLFALFLLLTKAASATTWYVRADGGSRYSANATAGQCDGQSDAAYPGSGVNQHCAFGDFRFLWDDQRSYNQLNWAISGGDTVIVDNTKQWRVGWDSPDGSNEPWCLGGDGSAPYGCSNPTIPAGTAAQHTRILGRNYASCSAGNQPDKTKMTQIFGGHGVWNVLNLTGAQYVDVQCLDITRHSSCILHGSPVYPKVCSATFPLDDYDSDGITTDTGTHDLLLQDLWIHGHTDRGVIGPIGGLVTANRVDVDTNGMAGWDLDRGDGTPSPNGSLKLSYTTIEWSGCNQEYPLVDPIPVASCYSQSTGGYGDGIGTPVTDMVSVSIDHSIFRYNTQDGEDFGHVILGGNLSITNSTSYANNGGQWKWAGFTNVVFENNLAVANCLRMSEPVAGTPSTFNTHLGDFCRAQDGVSFAFNNGGTGLIAGNTFISYAPTTFDVQCYDNTSCANTTINMTDNIVLGYANASTLNMGGRDGGVGGFCGAGCNSTTVPIGTFNRANNIFYGIRGACIANQLQAASKGSITGESCLDPGFVNEPASFTSEATLDAFNFALSSSSPARAGGTAMAEMAADYLGAARSTPPSVGGLEYGSQASLSNLVSWLIPGNTAPTAPTAPTSPSIPTTPVVTSPPPPGSGTPTPTGAAATSTVLTVVKTGDPSNPATLTAHVAPISTSNGKLRGRVRIYNSNNWPIGHGTLSASGTMTWTVPSKFAGLTVYAVYAGNNQYLQSTSAPVNLSAAITTLNNSQ